MTELERTQRALGAAMAYLRGIDSPGAFKTMQYIDDILKPPPTYEEVTVERWECPDCGSVYMVSHGRAEDDPCAKSEPWGDCACSGGRLKEDKATKLTGTRHVPVKQPVRKRVTVERVMWTDNTGNMVPLLGRFSEGSDYRQFLGKTGTLTFEWEE